MEPWLKGLVATACVVVIGWGGYLALQEYEHRQEAQRAAQAERDLIAIKKERESQSSGAKWLQAQQDTSLISLCQKALNEAKSAAGGAIEQDVRQRIEKCISGGRLPAEDVAEARKLVAAD